MKLELRKNMYVRTKDGIIAKVDYIDDNTIFFDKDLYRTYGDSINFLEKDNLEKIVKASYNIIDILEVGDYVNGCYVSNKRASVNEHLGGHPKEIGIIKCNAYFNQGNYNDCKFEWIEEQDIKSIVTHEQIEQMSYKVGD